MKRKIMIFMALGVLLTAIFAYADEDTTTFTFVIPTSISHTLSYGGSCSASLFYFVDEDGTYDGTMDQINVSSDIVPQQNYCQDDVNGVMTVNNAGNAAINISAKIASYLGGIDVKTSLAYAGYEATCSGPPSSVTECTNMSLTYQQVAGDIAKGGDDELWWWADMNNFNSGAATDGITRVVTTNATQS